MSPALAVRKTSKIQLPEGSAPGDVLLVISTHSGKVILKNKITPGKYAGRCSGVSVPSEDYCTVVVDGETGFRCGTSWRHQHAMRLALHRKKCANGGCCRFWGCNPSSEEERALVERLMQEVDPRTLSAYRVYNKKTTRTAATCFGRPNEHAWEEETSAKRVLSF